MRNWLLMKEESLRSAFTFSSDVSLHALFTVERECSWNARGQFPTRVYFHVRTHLPRVLNARNGEFSRIFRSRWVFVSHNDYGPRIVPIVVYLWTARVCSAYSLRARHARTHAHPVVRLRTCTSHERRYRVFQTRRRNALSRCSDRCRGIRGSRAKETCDRKEMRVSCRTRVTIACPVVWSNDFSKSNVKAREYIESSFYRDNRIAIRKALFEMIIRRLKNYLVYILREWSNLPFKDTSLLQSFII